MLLNPAGSTEKTPLNLQKGYKPEKSHPMVESNALYKFKDIS